MHEQTGLTNPPARPATPRAALAAAARAACEPLEPRRLFAAFAPLEVAVGPNVNISRTFSNQNEGAIAIDPTDPARLFTASVIDDNDTGPLDPDVNDNALFTAFSDNAGVTFGAALIGTGADGFAAARGAPSVAWDEFGNLYLAYRGFNPAAPPPDPTDPTPSLGTVIEVLVSTDGGRTFRNIYRTTGGVEGPRRATIPLTAEPTITVGEGTAWLTFDRLISRAGLGVVREQVAVGARINGLDATEAFGRIQVIPRSTDARFGDIEIGPNGEVAVGFQAPLGAGGRIASLYASVDPDGLGPRDFERRYEISSTNVSFFDNIPAQDDRAIDADLRLAWDRSGGPFNGRMYAVYTDEPRNESNSDTNIYLRFSDDNAATWSTPRQVNDQDLGERSQFLPNVALDQVSGNIAIVWHDARDTPQVTFGENDETQLRGTAGIPTVGEEGVRFATNVRISAGTSDVHRARAALEYGGYLGLDFRNNVFHPVWADNSNSTRDNPSGGVETGTPLATLDLYTARVTVTEVAPPPDPERPIGPASALSPEYLGKDTISRGKLNKFRIEYESSSGVDLTSLGDDDLLVTGPNGFNLFADFQKAKRAKRGTVVIGTYTIPAPGGLYDQGDNGLYSILLRAGAVRDLAGVTSDAGLVDQFLVSSTVPAQSPALQPAAPRAAALQAASTRLGEDDEGDDKLGAVGLD
jgi:hypothetical protein